jgi:succinate dehydrogenase flavin-adding protein (antitoxin of CptAB toxin-antitoxin module)
MNFKKVIFRYRRDIQSIPRKELIQNLENIRANYLKALPTFKEQFRMEAFSNRGLGELDIRSKITRYINILKKRKLTKKEAKMFKGFLESQAKKVTPANEKSYKRLAKQETKFEWKEYKKMARQFDSAAPSQLDDIVKALNLTDEDLRQFLNSNRNVDLSHVVWDSEGLEAFETDYHIDLPTARLIDWLGYDYAEYGLTGAFVPKKDK